MPALEQQVITGLAPGRQRHQEKSGKCPHGCPCV
jgi:hypothetical protein